MYHENRDAVMSMSSMTKAERNKMEYLELLVVLDY